MGMDLDEHDAYAAELWSDDPEVELTNSPLDRNAQHGVNDEKDKERDARFAPLLARIAAMFQRGDG